MKRTDNLNIVCFKPLITPEELKKEIPETDEVANVVATARKDIQRILTNRDKRRLVITGPCSLHDREATLEYAAKLRKLQDQVSDTVLIVMRTYFEKPRTTLGWKGMLYDPRLDERFPREKGCHDQSSWCKYGLIVNGRVKSNRSN